MFLFTLIFALLPAFLLLWYFYKRDLNPEPFGVLMRTFFLGVAITIPIVIVELVLMQFQSGFTDPISYGLYTAFICAAAPEELFKFLALTLYCLPHSEFDEPQDAVVYGATVSLGFAALWREMTI